MTTYRPTMEGRRPADRPARTCLSDGRSAATLRDVRLYRATRAEFRPVAD